MENNVSRFESISKAYEDALRNLNALEVFDDQNMSVICPRMRNACTRIGLSMEDIDNLNIIHVTGTKGKGSTCAFSESILRHHGYKTGLFINPCLFEQREVIVLYGEVISKCTFVDIFWTVYNKLVATKEQFDREMPQRVEMLLLMALYLFVREKVDVVILEVSLGGEYDCTNIVNHPTVCAVGSIAIDHAQWLGSSLESIAWHKSGIFKKGSPAVTTYDQPFEVFQYLQRRAEEKGVLLFKATTFDALDKGKGQIRLGIEGEIQKVNAALALQITAIWLRQKGRDIACTGSESDSYPEITCHGKGIKDYEQFRVTEQMLRGLANCTLQGRCNTIVKENITYYLDVAHTEKSIQCAVDWFLHKSTKEAAGKSNGVIKVLIFHTTEGRDPKRHLKPLTSCEFHAAVFCPYQIEKASSSEDEKFADSPLDSHREQSIKNLEAWRGLIQVNRADDQVFTCLYDTLIWICQGCDPMINYDKTVDKVSLLLQSENHKQVLVLGSLRLVGGVINLVTPK